MYKQNFKSPILKALVGKQKNLPQHLQDAIKAAPESPAKMKDLSGDGKVTKKDVLIGRGVLKADGSPAKMYKSPLKQTTAGEFAYEKHRKDMEMGKATKPIDKVKAALTAMTSDNVTYSEAKKQLRKEQKAKYKAKKSPAKKHCY